MGEPVVSIIIPYYHSWKYFDRCIKSILSQTYQNYEIIVYCDNPTFDDMTMFLKYSKELQGKFVYFTNFLKTSPAIARNKALKFARGEVIAFIDSDDEWLPEKLELQVQMMNHCDVCFTSGTYHTPVGIFFMPYSSENICNSFCHSMFIFSSVMVRKEVITDMISDRGYVFDEEFKSCDDTEFLAYLYTHDYKFCSVKRDLVRFHEHDSNLSQGHTVKTCCTAGKAYFKNRMYLSAFYIWVIAIVACIANKFGLIPALRKIHLSSKGLKVQ